MTGDWWMLVSSATDPRWRAHHVRAGELVEIRNMRTGQSGIDGVATANPRFIASSEGLVYEQPQVVKTESGSLLKPGVPVLSGAVPRFTLRRVR
jgi:hypothetical protein